MAEILAANTSALAYAAKLAALDSRAAVDTDDVDRAASAADAAYTIMLLTLRLAETDGMRMTGANMLNIDYARGAYVDFKVARHVENSRHTTLGARATTVTIFAQKVVEEIAKRAEV